MTNKEDKDIFTQQMQGVMPLKPSDKERDKYTSQQNNKHSVDYVDYLAYENTNQEYIAGDKVISYSGSIAGTMDYIRLKKSHISHDATLDLHNCTIEQAEYELRGFLQDTRKSKCVRIVHGKGLHNDNKKAILKTFVANYLKQQPMVAAYHSCDKKNGGTGALLVLYV